MTRAATSALIALVLIPSALIFGGLMHSDAQAGRGVEHVTHESPRVTPLPLAPVVRLSGQPVLDEPLQVPEPPWWINVIAVFGPDDQRPVTSEPHVLSYAEWRNEHTDRPCAVYAGLQLTPDRAVELVAMFSWPGQTPQQMAATFQRESSLFVGARNICTDDLGIAQISWPYHSERPLCSDRELLLTDVLYNLRCAEDIYGEQGIRAWVAAEGVLWERGD